MQDILRFRDVPIIKVLSGIRRSGKSTLLQLLAEELHEQDVMESSIIHHRYTSMDGEPTASAEEMFQQLKAECEGKGRCYLLLDEVQEIEGWEKVVNSLFEDLGHDIYISGSNSRLLAGEMSTYLSGRFVEIPVYPLSYAEYADFRKQNGKRSSIEDYIRQGGFPLIADNSFDDRTAYQLVYGIYTSVIMRDIQRRHRITNMALFSKVVDFIIENVGKTFSANSIVKFLKGQGRSLTVETIYDCLEWLQEAVIVYKCKRYDIKGRQILEASEKWYLADHSLVWALQEYRSSYIAPVMENIVYMELRRRGYAVFAGKLHDKEIDFIAEKGSRRIYVQVCRSLPESSSKELDNLRAIADNHPKIIVTFDKYDEDNIDGILVTSLEKFLLET